MNTFFLGLENGVHGGTHAPDIGVLGDLQIKPFERRFDLLVFQYAL